MTQQLLKSRLLVSAQCAPEQMQPDFETQFEESYQNFSISNTYNFMQHHYFK